MTDETISVFKLAVGMVVLVAVVARVRSIAARSKRIRAFSGPQFNRIVIRVGIDFRDRLPPEAIAAEATALAREHSFDWTEKPFTDALLARLNAREQSGAFDAYRRAQALAAITTATDRANRAAFSALHEADPLSVVVDGALHRIDVTPDAPMSWGRYKGHWYAYRSDDVEATLEYLGARTIKRANWQSGTAISWLKDSPWTFVPPAINGWVVVVGSEFIPTYSEPLMDRWKERFAAHSKHFGEVQFFASHRTSGSVQHAKAVDGVIVRIFDSQDGNVNEWGAPTAEEIAAGYDRWQANKDEQHHMWQPGDSAGEWSGSEHLPFLIAAGWSVDPGKYNEMGLPPSVGYLVQF